MCRARSCTNSHLTGDTQGELGGGAERTLAWTLEGAHRRHSFPGCDLWPCPLLVSSLPWASSRPRHQPSLLSLLAAPLLPPTLSHVPLGGSAPPSAISAMLGALGTRPSHPATSSLDIECLLHCSGPPGPVTHLSPASLSGAALPPPRGQSGQSAHHLDLSVSRLLPPSPGLGSGWQCCSKVTAEVLVTCWCLPMTWHFSKGFARINSLTPPNNPSGYQYVSTLQTRKQAQRG